jgi:hypothetical protein
VAVPSGAATFVCTADVVVPLCTLIFRRVSRPARVVSLTSSTSSDHLIFTIEAKDSQQTPMPLNVPKTDGSSYFSFTDDAWPGISGELVLHRAVGKTPRGATEPPSRGRPFAKTKTLHRESNLQRTPFDRLRNVVGISYESSAFITILDGLRPSFQGLSSR